MSKMNDLAQLLDELAATGKTLKACADSLFKTTKALRAGLPAGDEPTAASDSPPEAPPVPEPPASPEPAPPEYTKEQIRGMLSGLAGDGHREEAKALVSKYANGGSFSDIDPARYPELAEEVQKIHG